MGYGLPRQDAQNDMEGLDAVVLVLGRKNLSGAVDIRTVYRAAGPSLNGQGETLEAFREFLKEEAAGTGALVRLGNGLPFSGGEGAVALTDEGIKHYFKMRPQYLKKR